jgi:hypothetical protein
MPKLKPEQLDLSSIVETITSQVQGTPGPIGPTGTAGVNGYTPRKGIDYFDGAIGPTGTVGSPGSPGTTDYGQLQNKPATFPPSTHAHAPADITGTAVVTADSRLSDARNAADVSSWAKSGTKPSYTAADVGAEASGNVATHSALKTAVHGLLGGVRIRAQAAPDAETGANTLTIADLLTGIVVGTPAGAVAYTLPTGTLCDAGMTIAINEAFDWILINVSTTAANIITLTAGVGHTIVGNAKIPANSTTTGGLWGTSGQRFRTRKTAANTFVTYGV